MQRRDPAMSRSPLPPILIPGPFRLLGYALCLFVVEPEAIGLATRGTSDHGAYWWAAYVMFSAAYHLFATAREGEMGARQRWTAMALDATSLLAMAIVAPCEFAQVGLVVVAIEGSLILPPRALFVGLAVHTAAISFVIMRGCGVSASLSWLLAITGFESAVVIAVLFARKEYRARIDLSRANAELRAARTMLAASAQREERHRIARELHDSLGHKLTALGLHLEVAQNVTSDKGATHVAKAAALSDDALAELRAAVGSMRQAAGPDVGSAIRQLCADIPGIACHLDLPSPFLVASSDRAHCLIRCVEEVLTNAMRHSGAKNLWLHIAEEGDSIELRARDDGQGAESLKSGNGLRGMRERLEAFGGRLVIATTPTFSILAQLPGSGAMR